MRSRTPKRLTPDAEKLVGCALALAASGSRMEDLFWESQLEQVLGRLLRTGNQNALDAALDHLQQNNGDAYGALADQLESHSESARVGTEDEPGPAWDILLVAAPVLAWTRYTIPSGPIKADVAATLQNHLQAHVLASGAQVALAPYLYSIDQLPRTHCETWRLTQLLAQSAVGGTPPRINAGNLPETAPILADPRFLLAAVAVQRGTAMFRWQEDDTHRAERGQCEEQWARQAGPNLALLLPGCELECLLPDAYYASCREADERIRPHTIRTALSYLQDTLSLTPPELRAVVAGFGEQRIDEYRIGLTERGSNDVIYGVVWPLYGRENGEAGNEVGEAEGGLIDEVVALLKDCGITEIRKHPGRFDPEYCDDCGVPLYPDPLGEIVHAEMPDGAEPSTPQFH